MGIYSRSDITFLATAADPEAVLKVRARRCTVVAAIFAFEVLVLVSARAHELYGKCAARPSPKSMQASAPRDCEPCPVVEVCCFVRRTYSLLPMVASISNARSVMNMSEPQGCRSWISVLDSRVLLVAEVGSIYQSTLIVWSFAKHAHLYHAVYDSSDDPS